MANYYVVLRRGESEASDAAVGSKPTESSKVLSNVVFASIAKIEAGSEEEAARAARSAYPGRANVKAAVIPEANWTEF